MLVVSCTFVVGVGGEGGEEGFIRERRSKVVVAVFDVVIDRGLC